MLLVFVITVKTLHPGRHKRDKLFSARLRAELQGTDGESPEINSETHISPFYGNPRERPIMVNKHIWLHNSDIIMALRNALHECGRSDISVFALIWGSVRLIKTFLPLYI